MEASFEERKREDSVRLLYLHQKKEGEREMVSLLRREQKWAGVLA